jgi:response regulator RpfG family c-di-GMP phosphodiesterase
VDDEEEVHAVTKLALDGFEFASRPLQIIDAYSGAEAKKIMSEENDIAMIMLDDHMETEQAGIDVDKYIRDELGNRFVRIILRTGQPGQAPEYKVITEYDINDYKQKTELTREKMFTLVYTSLSCYRDMMALEANRHGLEKVIEASAYIFGLRSLGQFTQGVLEQLTALLYLDKDAVLMKAAALATYPQNHQLSIVAGTGRYSDYVGKNAEEVLDADVLKIIQQSRSAKENTYGEDFCVDYHVTESGSEQIIYVSGSQPLSIPDRHMIDLFSHNVAIAHENVHLIEDKK